MIKKYFNYYKKKIGRYFNKNTKSRLIVAGLMIAAISLLSFGVYYLTKEGLLSTQEGNDPFIIKAVPLYIYQLFFLITGFLIFVSSSIFGLFNFFKGDRDSWIMASPNFESLSWIKFFRAVLDSSWPIIILALPLLLAVQSVFKLSGVLFTISLLSVLFFSLFASSFAIIIIFAISLLFKKIKIKSFKALAVTVGMFCLVVGVTIWNRVVSVNVEKLFQVEEAVNPSLIYLVNNFSIFPSSLPAMTVYYSQVGNLSEALKQATLITSFFLLVFTLFSLIKKKFLYVWQLFQEGSFEAKTSKKKVNGPKIISSRFPKSKQDTIFKKELLTSIRSPQNFFWFAFLMILMFSQVGVINLLEKYVGIGASQHAAVAGLTPSLQVGVILFFTSALILRFVFPSLSQEGDTAWILGSAPIDFKEIFTTKYKFYGSLLTLIGLLGLLIYIVPLSVSFEVALISAIILIPGILTLTMLGLSFGTLFVNFETNDPQKLSTSGPGIGFILASLFYGGLGSYLLYEIFSKESYLLVIIFLLFSFAVYKIMKSLAIKSLEDLEFL
ncbi:MAG: putative ABC transporter permease subunit [Patescibacteria group bacterium]